MTHLHFSSYLWLALAAICSAPKAASSPPNPIAPRIVSSQTKITDSENHVLRAHEDAASAHVHGDMVARAAVFLGSSKTGSSNVVAQSTPVASSPATSSSISHKPALYYSSRNVTIKISSAAVNSNTPKGQLLTNGTLAASLTMSSSTAIGLLLDDSITPAISTMSSSTAVALLNGISNSLTVLKMTSSILSVARLINSTISTSSPITTSGAAGTQVYRVTTAEDLPSRSSNTSQTSSSGLMPTVVTASINPTNSAALADGIALGGALLSFYKSAAQIGPDIVKPPIKTDSLKSLETIESDLGDAFKDRGGVDTGAPCVAKKKRFRLRNRDLISQVLNDFRCAIDSVNTLKIHLSMENPDPTVLADDLEAVGTRAQELETDETDDDDDDDDDKTATTSETTTTSEASETTTKSDSRSQRATNTLTTSSSVSRSYASMATRSSTSDPTSQQTTILTTSSSISKSSASRTPTMSSGQSSNATCYTGSEYLFPASATASAPGDSQSVAFHLANFALSNFFAMDPPVPFTAKSPFSTLAKNSSMTKPSSKTSSAFTQSSQSFLTVTTALSEMHPAFTPLPSSTINPTYISRPIAAPVPGQNGVAQCVYEM